MNKFAVAAALVAVTVGLVAVSLASANPAPKHGGRVEHEPFEHETGELERHHHGHHGKGPHRGRREHKHPTGYRPEHKHPTGYKPHHPHRPHHQCGADRGHEHRHEQPEYPRGHRGGEEFEQGEEFQEESAEFEQGEENGNVFESGRAQESEGAEFSRGEEFGGGRRHGHGGRGGHRGQRNQESGRRSGGGFKGVGVFGGFEKEKEFDAGVRASDKNRNRNQFSKNKAVVAGEQKAVGAGSSSSDVNNVEGVHQHKNHNNDRLVVKETQRGTEDTDAFRGENARNNENHFGASDTKVFGAQAGESGSSEHDSDKEFEAGVHKKNSVAGAGGAGAFGGRF